MQQEAKLKFLGMEEKSETKQRERREYLGIEAKARNYKADLYRVNPT